MGDKIDIYYAPLCIETKKDSLPTCDQVSIRRFDEESGMLIPNRNYYEIYLRKPIPSITGIRSVGSYTAFHEICGKPGITKLRKRYFPV